MTHGPWAFRYCFSNPKPTDPPFGIPRLRLPSPDPRPSQVFFIGADKVSIPFLPPTKTPIKDALFQDITISSCKGYCGIEHSCANVASPKNRHQRALETVGFHSLLLFDFLFGGGQMYEPRLLPILLPILLSFVVPRISPSRSR